MSIASFIDKVRVEPEQVEQTSSNKDTRVQQEAKNNEGLQNNATRAEPRPLQTAATPREQRLDLMLDGKVIKASYNSGVKERFVHVSHIISDSEGQRQRFIVGARATVKDRHGEWGAALSILDAMLLDAMPRPLVPEDEAWLVSHDAGMTVKAFAAWLHENHIFYLSRVKGNCGHLFEWVCGWGEQMRAQRPEGDFFDSARICGSECHSRRLWRVELPEPARGIYPGIRQVIMVEKKRLGDPESCELQYLITSYPSESITARELLQRILLHWDTETGVFGGKDNTFGEDRARYRQIEAAMARTCLDNIVFNLLNAPTFESFWPPGAPLSNRIQFFRDHPEYCPIQMSEANS